MYHARGMITSSFLRMEAVSTSLLSPSRTRRAITVRRPSSNFEELRAVQVDSTSSVSSACTSTG